MFLDDDASIMSCNGYPVVGNSKDFANLNGDFVVAVVGENVVIGAGTVVMAGAVVNAAAKTGKGCIINTCSSADHDCVLGDYVHLSVGAHTAGAYTIGDGTWIGAGATIINNIDICGDVIVGAGVLLIRNMLIGLTQQATTT